MGSTLFVLPLFFIFCTITIDCIPVQKYSKWLFATKKLESKQVHNKQVYNFSIIQQNQHRLNANHDSVNYFNTWLHNCQDDKLNSSICAMISLIGVRKPSMLHSKTAMISNRFPQWLHQAKTWHVWPWSLQLLIHLLYWSLGSKNVFFCPHRCQISPTNSIAKQHHYFP